MLWNFYDSNILNIRFDVEDCICFSCLDPLTGTFTEKSQLTPGDNQALKNRWGIDFQELFQRLPDFRDTLAGCPDGDVSLAGGARYTHRGGGLYAQRQVACPMDILAREGEIAALLWPCRDILKVLVRDGLEDETVLGQWGGYARTGVYPVSAPISRRVPMADGVKLSTDVYLPQGAPHPLPAILVRTPYGIQNNREHYYRYVQRGYAVVLQDVRGREDSDGDFIPCDCETEDGDATLDWIAAQPWSNGSVGMMGASYLGYVQWAAAASGNPHLKAMLSMVTSGSAFVDIPRRGGCFTSGMLAWSFAMSQQRMRADLMVREDWDQVLDIRPLGDIPRKSLGHDIPFLNKWLSHRDEDDFWRRGDWCARLKDAKHPPVPTLLVSGWFDDNGMGSTQALELMKDYPPEARKVVLGPWIHSFNSRYDIHGIPMGTEAIRYDIDLLFLGWLDRHLKGVNNGIDGSPRVEYYTLGENRWKTAANWPLPGQNTHTLFLAQDGGLCPEPGTDGAAAYHYDPADPAEHVIDMSENELEVPADYTEVERREDVLCFTTAPLEQGLTVTGDIQVELYISSSAPDTDFVVRLCEVTADDRSIKLADAVLGAKYRNGFSAPEYLEPGEVSKLVLRTTKISKQFAAGTSIRLTVTSGAKNFIFPNSNTRDGFDSEVTVVAENKVHFGISTPSRILLPVEE